MAVLAGVGHGVECVAHCDDACGERDRRAGQSVGVAASVDAFMVASHEWSDGRQRGDGAHDRLAIDGVVLDQLVLGGSQPAGLVEQRVGCVQFPDVVEQRGEAEVAELVTGESAPLTDPQGERSGAHDVIARDRIFVLERGDEAMHGRGQPDCERGQRVEDEHGSEEIGHRSVEPVGAIHADAAAEDTGDVEPVYQPPAGAERRCAEPDERSGRQQDETQRRHEGGRPLADPVQRKLLP